METHDITTKMILWSDDDVHTYSFLSPIISTSEMHKEVGMDKEVLLQVCQEQFRMVVGLVLAG